MHCMNSTRIKNANEGLRIEKKVTIHCDDKWLN
jgi:hypothetical protein